MKTVKFYTLGCKANQYDTQLIREQFINAGFRELDNHKLADVYLINTCTVTHRADADSLNFIRKARRENPKAKVVVTGCLTELDAERIKKIRGLCLIIKNRDKEKILSRLLHLQARATKKGISYFQGHTRAFVKIQDGCDNFCSYCKVPFVRGNSKSKQKNEIVKEAQRLVKNGFKEIVLSGICLGAYGGDLKQKIGLVDIVEALERIDGLLRIRLSSIEAGDITDELIDKLSKSKKLCRHLHIPIQSGDDEILKRMNRGYARSDYINLIKKIRKKMPQIAITTDCLIGFPGETEENFQNTVSLIKEILPLKVHIFPYSRRGGTAASYFKQELSQQIIRKRINCLKEIAGVCALKYEERFLQKKMNVLVEEPSKDGFNTWEGLTDNYLKVLIKSGSDLKNQLVRVKLEKIVKDALLGEIIY